MIKITDKDESLSIISGCNNEEKRFITKQLSFLIPNAYFIPAVRAGFASPYKYFFKIHNDLIIVPKGLIPLLVKALKIENFQCEYTPITYNDIIPSFDNFQKFISKLNIPFEPYDYQIQAAYDSIFLHRQINLMATGSGKSLTIYLLVRWFLLHKMKIVIVVPNIMLVNQIRSDFIDYGLDEEKANELIHLIGGDHKIKHFEKPVTISTWQSLYTSPKMFEDVDALIIDEVHGAKADSYDVIFKASTGARYRLGFTGTLPKDAIEKMTIVSSMGPEKRYITARGLIDRGLATPAIIKTIFFSYPENERHSVKKMTYQQEVKYFSEHSRRNKTLSKIAYKMSLEEGKGNVIVLFDRKEHGKTLALETFKLKYGYDIDIKELMKPDNPYNIYYLVGEVKGKDREKIRKLLESNTNCIVFGTSSILSTGINIKNLHHLMLVSGGKSSIKLNQSIGRLLRTHASKDIVYIWDFIDDCNIPGKSSIYENYYLRHFKERLVEYNENEYPIEEKILEI